MTHLSFKSIIIILNLLSGNAHFSVVTHYLHLTTFQVAVLFMFDDSKFLEKKH